VIATPVAMEITGLASHDPNLKNYGLQTGVSLGLMAVIILPEAKRRCGDFLKRHLPGPGR